MFRKTIKFCLVFSLVLTACAPAAQAEPVLQAGPVIQSQPPLNLQPSTFTPTVVQSQPPVNLEPSTFTPIPATTNLSPTHTPVIVGTFETSLPVAGWNNREQENSLYLLDPDSRQALPDFPRISLGESYNFAFSPDHRMLAVKTPGSLILLDLPTWEVRKFDLRLSGYAAGMAFSPDGRLLGIVGAYQESQVVTFDITQEAILARASLDFLASRLWFTSDGRGLVVYGAPTKNRFTVNQMNAGPPQVVILNPEDLSQRWSAILEGVRDGIFPKGEKPGDTVDLSEPDSAIYFYPGLAFDPKQDILYAIHPDREKLTRVDLTAQKVETVEIYTPLTWFERLLSMGASVAQAKVAQGTYMRAVVSPDGQVLYVLGQRNTLTQNKNGNLQTISDSLGLQMIRTADGARLARFSTEAGELSMSPDGRYLYLGNWTDNKPWTDVFDTSKQEIVSRLDGFFKPAYRMNGELLLTSSAENRITILDYQSLEVLADWRGPQYLAWLSTP